MPCDFFYFSTFGRLNVAGGKNNHLWSNAEFNSASFENHVFLKWPQGGQKQHLSLKIKKLKNLKIIIQNSNVKTPATVYRKKLVT